MTDPTPLEAAATRAAELRNKLESARAELNQAKGGVILAERAYSAAIAAGGDFDGAHASRDQAKLAVSHLEERVAHLESAVAAAQQRQHAAFIETHRSEWDAGVAKRIEAAKLQDEARATQARAAAAKAQGDKLILSARSKGFNSEIDRSDGFTFSKIFQTLDAEAAERAKWDSV